MRDRIEAALAPALAFAWRYWPGVAAAVSAAMLATAHTFEALGYEPCLLCLRQREVYWGVLWIAGASAWFWARHPEGRIARAAQVLVGTAFLTGAIIAGYHAGVEWKFWPGPAACALSNLNNVSADSIAAALGAGGPAVVCDEAAWRDPILRLSMAGWNALISIGLAVASFLAAQRTLERVETEDEGGPQPQQQGQHA
ncbi:MAG: disulfide bond formation protein B [Maricaulaceae bacterium]|jgi:disulfide bond formation protein DsbB